MTTQKFFERGLAKLFKEGQVSDINIYSYTFTDDGAGDDYDDTVTLTATGSVQASGVMFPIMSEQGSSEALLIEQGKLLTDDKILYTGSVNTSGALLFGIGNDYYSVIPDGIQDWKIGGNTVFKKIFLRHNRTGSLI